MSKVPHFSVEQLDYLKKVTPLASVTIHSTQAEFIHNVIVSEFHTMIDNMLTKLHGTRYVPSGGRHG